MKNSFKKSMVVLFIAMMGFTMINCPGKKKDDTALLAALLFSNQGIAGSDLCDGVGVPNPTQILEGTISTAVTVSGSALLRGTVSVTNGGSITVLPKSVIYGERGSSLFVYEGGSISAIGTASNPICFTSAATVGSRAPGDWGGIVIIGNSSVHAHTAPNNSEGTNPRPYPGTQNGIANFKYVVVEFVGNEVAPGNELNGISSYTVTQDSNYDYVQIHRPLDDGFEWWGGNVNGSHLLVSGGMDDDFDVDEGFTGTLNHIISVKYPESCGGTKSTDPHGFEMDGTEGGAAIAGPSNPTVTNFTTIGQSYTGGVGMRIRERHTGNFSKGLVYGYVTNNFQCDVDTNPTTWTNVKGQSGKGANINGSCTNVTNNTEITSLPIVTLGNIETCGTGATKPDFTTTFGDGSLGGGSVAEGKWWDGWAVFRSK
ncbi:hypothetical protein EHQ43_03495 [Leptospira bouyouniensis]|uniref:Lipoprotein n=1 Tax=Leptospira bouyouniensis TaxID=2484911 RepID=A0A7I0ISC0_9LEPT|nr:hypothetical protein [Leptospira bouyouniensis]TGL08119.1 hypothetical protein EHQ43_03495 [Leptospira bouyouniensis]